MPLCPRQVGGKMARFEVGNKMARFEVGSKMARFEVGNKMARAEGRVGVEPRRPGRSGPQPNTWTHSCSH